MNVKKSYGLGFFLLAISQFSSAELLDGKGIDFAGGKLSPEFTVKKFYDDNVTTEPGPVIRSFATQVEPHLIYELKNNKNRYTLDYLLSAATYYGSHEDDFIDQTFKAGYGYTPTKKISAGIDAEYYDGHDPRGTGADVTAGVGANYDKYHHFKILANAAYGAESAKGRLEADIGHIAKDYDNNRTTTNVLDRNDLFGSARLYYRVMPKTKMVFEGRVNEYTYDTDRTPASLENTTYLGLVGVKWEKTLKTTGTAQIGYFHKDFSSSRRKNGEDFTWDVGVEWKPKKYSTFNLYTNRSHSESTGVGDFTLTDTIKLEYTHEWTSKIKTHLSIDYSESNFIEDTSRREDDKLNFDAGVDFEPRRWLKMGASYRYEERESTNNQFDYDRNIVEAYATVVF